MTTMLMATLTAQPGSLHIGAPLWITFTVSNTTPAPVAVVNPDVGTPDAGSGWPFSHETYQIAVLASFDLIELRLLTDDGTAVRATMPNAWATPILLPPHTLAPGESFALRIDLSECFDLRQAGRYQLWVRYGDHLVRAEAALELVIDAP